MRTVAVALLWLSTVAGAQTTSAPPPPPLQPVQVDSKAAKPAPARPRSTINLSPADRQAIDARELQAIKPTSLEEALQPAPAGAQDNAVIERDDGANTTRIEQLRRSNRISEVIVTPAGSTRSYTMTNREGRQPFGTTQMSPGLSVPNFFRFEFGRAAPTPLAPPAPPPVTSPAAAKPSN